jgi:hypothetical protein
MVYYLRRDLDTAYGQVLRISGVNAFDINNKNHSKWAKVTFKKKKDVRVKMDSNAEDTTQAKHEKSLSPSHVLQENSTFISKRVSGLSVPYCSIASA